MLWVLICTMHLTICYYYVTYVFQSESTLYSADTGRNLNAPNTFRRRSGRPLNGLRSIYALCLRGIIVWISWNSLLKTDATKQTHHCGEYKTYVLYHICFVFTAMMENQMLDETVLKCIQLENLVGQTRKCEWKS